MVSLIATILNEKDNIEKWFDGILSQSVIPDEIVIVDGGSTDGTWEWLLEKSGGNKAIKVFKRPGNISTGRNYAIKNSQWDIIVVTDAGCIYDRDWFKKIIQPISSGGSELSSTAFGPWFEDKDSFLTFLIAAATIPSKNEFQKDWLPSSRSIAFKKSLWSKVGGYPEWIPICEDIVFDLELKKIGARFEYIREPLVFWQPRKTLKKYFKQLYKYTKSDGHGKLWLNRQLIRYIVYAFSAILLVVSFVISKFFLAVLFLGLFIYTKKFLVRWLSFTEDFNIAKRIIGVILMPFIIIFGDLAKMSGWPVGVYERRIGKITFEKYL